MLHKMILLLPPSPLPPKDSWLLGFKSQETVLLNLSFTASREAVFDNLEMLLLAEPSEDRLDDCPWVWGRYLGTFYSEKPQLMHGLLPAVCQRAGETTLKKNEISLPNIFILWWVFCTTEYCISLNMGSAFLYLRWISVDFYNLFSCFWIYLSKTSLILICVCVYSWSLKILDHNVQIFRSKWVGFS